MEKKDLKAKFEKNRNFGLLKVGKNKKKQSQAIIDMGDRVGTNFGRMDNDRLIGIVKGTNIEDIRKLSKYYAQTNGVYSRATRYLADLYRFDFVIYPNLDLTEDAGNEKFKKKVLKGFNEVLEHFDKSSVQLLCRRWASQVCLEGVYYGYIVEDVNDKLVVQDLPTDYCRSRFLHRGLPLIEFNIEYFNKIAERNDKRERILNLFPKEIRDGYKKFKKAKPEDKWILLDDKRAFKFNFSDSDIPPFISSIPSLIGLAEVQDLEKEKLLQQLQKILIQEFELDKNGQIPFTMQELQRLSINAMDAVEDAVGVSVLSTVAKVHLEDLAGEDGARSDKAIDSAENSVYNDLGISNNLFNTDGNLALEKSITTDQSFVKPLLLQFERFFNNYLEWRFNSSKLEFRMKMLDTTIFNHKEMSSAYQNLTKIGFSRFLPMAALGHSQKEVVSLAKLEQQIIELDLISAPPFSSNTMSSETWKEIKELQKGALEGKSPTDINSQVKDLIQKDGSADGGRPELKDDEKSAKTIANKESMG